MSLRCLLALPVALLGCTAPTADDAPVDAPVDTEESDAPVDTDDTVDTDTIVDTEESDAPVDTDDTVDTVDTDIVDTDPGPIPTVSDCFDAQWAGRAPVDYVSLAPTMGRHCKGTNHQDIQGVERVVFVGDSVTLGTPGPEDDLSIIPNSRWWRNRVADDLATRFGLQAPGALWRQNDLIAGDPRQTFSGDFAVCAKYGARTDDLLMDPHRQLETCMPEADRGLRTLVLMTIGGNDIFSLLEDVKAGVDEPTLRATYSRATNLLREAITWVKEPGRFPNGVYVVFANTWEFTDPDSAHDMASCPGAQLIGLDTPLRDPILQDILAEAAETYLSIAVDTQTDLVFLGEAACGHGHDPANTTSRCYRGPGAKVWFDITCEHPSRAGHDGLRDLFVSVISE